MSAGTVNFWHSSGRRRILVASRNMVDASVLSVQWLSSGERVAARMERNVSSAKATQACHKTDAAFYGACFSGHMLCGSGLSGGKHHSFDFFYKKINMTKMLKILYIDVKNKKKTICCKMRKNVEKTRK